jgi:hypothetical protein
MCDPKKCKGCIRVYYSIGGWKTAMMLPFRDETECGCEPYQTGFPYKNSKTARMMGKIWAEEEGLPFNG